MPSVLVALRATHALLCYLALFAVAAWFTFYCARGPAVLMLTQQQQLVASTLYGFLSDTLWLLLSCVGCSGGMVFTFYKARGLGVGSSLVEEDQLELAKKLEQVAKVSDCNKCVTIVLQVCYSYSFCGGAIFMW
jgi:hypothetical protein